MISFSYKILHLTPHMGGGVGSVLTNYLIETKENLVFKHSLYSLEHINLHSKELLINNNIEFKENLSFNYSSILNKISDFDIIIIHWWNHPLLYEFLTKFTLPLSRVIMWSHISGLHSPSNFSKHLFTYADKFVFTTPISYQSDIVKNLSQENINKLSVICSSTNIDYLKNIKKEPTNNFIIGYLGTVDYSKLYKNFLKMSSKINIKNKKFIICGGDNQEAILKEAKKHKIHSNFIFTGKIADIKPYLSKFDVFGYPLSPYHFGTCDQALKEAMAMGIVPVVFNNPMEATLVRHLENGLIVENEEEYIKAIELLYYNPELKNQLSINAKEYAFKHFNSGKMIDDWEKVFYEILDIKPTKKVWSGKNYGENITPLQIFLESTGENYNYFESLLKSQPIDLNKNITSNWFSESKGSISHYYKLLKDPILLEIDTLFKTIYKKEII